MGKSFLKDSEEERGAVPGCTGALLEIVEIERTRTKETSKTPGARKYTIQLKIIEPEEVAGLMVFDHRCVVGTADDLMAKKPETWKRQEGGAARLKRLMVRSGTPISDDDSEWMEAAEGQRVIAPLLEQDGFPTSPGLYYREGDEDAPPIGLSDGKPAKKGAKGKGPAAAAQAARSRKAVKEEPEEEEEESEDEKDADEEEEEEKPKAKPAAKGKKAATPKKESDEDDDDEDDED